MKASHVTVINKQTTMYYIHHFLVSLNKSCLQRFYFIHKATTTQPPTTGLQLCDRNRQYNHPPSSIPTVYASPSPGSSTLGSGMERDELAMQTKGEKPYSRSVRHSQSRHSLKIVASPHFSTGQCCQRNNLFGCSSWSHRHLFCTLVTIQEDASRLPRLFTTAAAFSPNRQN